MSGYGILDYEGMNQAIYRGATSNIVVDTQKMGIGIGVDQNGPSSNLHVVGNTRLEGDINMIHTSNTSSMKVNSNVVTEFPRSKKLIKYPRVALTSDASTTSGYQGYKVSSSYFYPGYHYDWEAFDNGGDSVGWHTADGALRAYSGSGGTYAGTLQTRLASNTELGEWLQIQLPDAIRLERYVITPQGSPGSWTNCPTSAVVYGSNDGTTWKEVHRYTDAISDGAGSTTFPFDANSTETYNHFALVVTKRNGAADGISVQEWELFGLPEYDPDAAGVDVKVASYPNVPNTDWLEVYYDAKESSSYPGTGGTVLDLSGNQINGTLNGGVGFDSEYKAFTFDGVDDYVTSTTLSSHFAGDPTVTYACWVKFNAMTTNQMFFTVNAPGIYGQGVIGGLFLGTDGTLYNTVGNRGIKALKKLVTNRWYHIVGTKTPGDTGTDTQKLYIDGIHVSTHPWNTSGNQVIGSNPVLRIGASGTGTDRMNGTMANARLFNRAITSDEVWQLYSYQKEYFGHGDLSMTLKAGRLGIGTSEPRGTLDVRGDMYCGCPVFWFASSQSSSGFLEYDQVHANKGGGLQGDRFVAPISGYYHMTLHNLSVSSGGVARLRWYLNGTDIDTARFGLYTTSDGYQNLAGSLIWYMKVGDYMQVNSQDTANMNTNFNGWSGFLLST